MSNIFIKDIVGTSTYAIPSDDTTLAAATSGLDALLNGIANFTYERVLAWVEDADGPGGVEGPRTLNCLVQTFTYLTKECPSETEVDALAYGGGVNVSIEDTLENDANITSIGQQHYSLFDSASSTSIWEIDTTNNEIQPTTPNKGRSFIVGSQSMDDTGAAADDNRMFFNKTKGAFRAGGVSGTDWDDANVGQFSAVLGYNCTATGRYSTARGYQCDATGRYSHCEGYVNSAAGLGSHAEGDSDVLGGRQGHAEGTSCTSNGDYGAHAEGQLTSSTGTCSHSEGMLTTSSGYGSHSEGLSTTASAPNSHAEGYSTTASSSSAHAEGRSTIAAAGFSHAEGQLSNVASGSNASHAEGYDTDVLAGIGCHAEGYETRVTINGSKGAHAEGYQAFADGPGVHAEGDGTTATGAYSHAEGSGTYSGGTAAHAEGYRTATYARGAHAEGRNTDANNEASHSEGFQSDAYFDTAHAASSGRPFTVQSGGLIRPVPQNVYALTGQYQRVTQAETVEAGGVSWVPLEMQMNSTALVVPTNYSYAVVIEVVARDGTIGGGNGDTATFFFKTAVKNVSGVVSFVGGTSPWPWIHSFKDSGAASWDARLVIGNTTPLALEIEVLGDLARATLWEATIHITEIGDMPELI